MADKVTFDGVNKLIICNTGVTSLDVKEDVYSKWKIWVTQADNAKYTEAISVLGGDPISDTLYLGSTFFLENDWKIRPQETNHTLTVSGNIYTRDGSNPVIATVGAYRVAINTVRSNLIDTVNIAGGSSGPSAADIAAEIVQILDDQNKFVPAIPVGDMG